MKETSIRSTVYAMMVAIVTLSSCAGEESEIQQSPPVPITVTVNNSNSPQTRDDEKTPYNTIADLQTTGFGLYCQPGTLDPLMSNQKFTYSTVNGWTYSPIKYWPSGTDTKLNFIAYAPYTTTTDKVSYTSATSEFTYQYTVNTESPFDNIDLCTAKALDKTSSDGEVDLSFQHQTGRLDVQVKVDGENTNYDANAKYFIKSVTINTNSLSPATLHVNRSQTTWIPITGASPITYNLNSLSHFKEGIFDPEFTTVEQFNPSTIPGLTTSLQGIFPESKILIVLPTFNENAFTITVNYVKYSVTGGEPSVLTKTEASQEFTPVILGISSGKLHTLNITLNP